MNAVPDTQSQLDDLELFQQALRRLAAEADRELAKRGINRSHHRALHCLWRREVLTVAGLARALAVTRQGLHKPLRQLIDGGLVESTVAPANRLQRQLRLTDAGRTLAAQLADRALRVLDGIFRDVGEGAADHWRAVMRRVASLPGSRGGKV